MAKSGSDLSGDGKVTRKDVLLVRCRFKNLAFLI